MKGYKLWMQILAHIHKYQAYNGTSWADVIAANTGGMMVSDGQNVKIVSTSGTVTALFLTVNGGQAASGTYNS